MDQARRIEDADQAERAAHSEPSTYEFEFDTEHKTDADGLRPGLRITPNIELLEALGIGGMGTVWLAQHSGLETRVAVKFMSSANAQDPALVERFAREAKLAARIKSPHVVQTFDYAMTPNGIPFIVMELLEGEDLQTHLTRTPRLPLEEGSRVVVQVCKALAKAHALGIVHRDIKPDNIFLVENDGEPFVKVLDFGIAKDQGPVPGITVSGTTMGTPSYMSPEQLFAPKDVGVRSDLWSTAVVAYRALTGRLPFEGDSFGAVCVAINGGTYPKPTSLNPEIPSTLDDWFARALSRKPEDRYQNATEMANAYLSSLHEAGLLPSWAVRRTATSSLSAFATDPGGISGGPITLHNHTPRHRHRLAKTLLGIAGAVSMVALGAATHRVALPVPLPSSNALFELLPAAWRPAPVPQLAPEVAPPHAVEAETPSDWLITPRRSATAVPDVPRPEVEVAPAPVTPAAVAPAPVAPMPASRATATPPPEPTPYDSDPPVVVPPADKGASPGAPAVDPLGI